MRPRPLNAYLPVLLSMIVLPLFIVTAMADAPLPVITAATADLASGRLVINGTAFGSVPPVVSLGGNQLVVSSFTDKQVVAVRPNGLNGSYLLTVTNSLSHQAGAFVITIGTTGPVGPPGPKGDTGATGQQGPQEQIPNIIGSYVGQVMVNATCPLSGITSNTVSATTTIASQQGGSFSGSSGDPDSSNTVFFTGTVDAAGNLNGTYNFSLGQISGGGNLTGHVSGGQLQMTLTGTVVSVAETCDQTFVFNGALATSAQSADLSIAGTGSSGQVASGNRITYTLTVSNAGPMDATAVVVNDPIPAGTTFSSATASQGQWQTPSPGTGGNATCSLGTLMKGESATVTITVNILAPAGFTLTDTAQVTSAAPDSNLANNTATIATPVIGGAIVKLVWTQPAPTASNPTPAPQNLTVQLAGTSTTAQSAGLIAPQDSCTLIAINIYKADSPPVVPIPSNLWQVVPPANFQATLAVAPAGSFYVITNLWKCGSTIIESGVSNQASVPAGPTISNLKVTGKLKGLGSGFVDGVQVFVNGVAFAKQAVFADTTLVIQKGPLSDGSAITDVGVANSALVTFKNPDGGMGSFSFKRP